MIEEHVEFLIGIVDAQLLKGVSWKVFKAKDVENSYKLGLLFARIGAFIYVRHQPGKSSWIEGLPHGMPETAISEFGQFGLSSYSRPRSLIIKSSPMLSSFL